MKKIVSFEKELDFPSMIGEITSIALDNNLDFIDQNTITGTFTISGSYKMTEASTLEENFKYEIPVDITLVETFDLSSVKVTIDNFNYEVINDDVLKCNIDVLIDGIEEIVLKEELIDNTEKNPDEVISTEELNLKEMESVRECDGDKMEDKELDMEKADIQEEVEFPFKQISEVKELNKEQEDKKEGDDKKMKNEEKELDNNLEGQNISSLFEAFSSTDETFKTYSVYILRREDTIETVLNKYSITREELSDYNDLENLEIGSKLVIPTSITIDE